MGIEEFANQSRDPSDICDEHRSDWSVYQPWLQQDPISQWNQLRSDTPVVFSGEFGGYWIITHYETIEWVARHPELFSNAELGIPHRQIYADKHIPIQVDGDEHRAWRKALTDVFGPKTVNHFEPEIRRTAQALIEPIWQNKCCEFVSDFAIALPAETFLVNFGIGRDRLNDLLDLKTWLRSHALASATEEEILKASRPLWDFFGETVDQRRSISTAGRYDVVSQLLEAQFSGRPLSRDEIINITFMTMLASLDTTTSMLGLIFCDLAQNPALQEFIATSRERIPGIVEELIRYEAMVTTGRVVTTEVVVHGRKMRPGDRVLMSWGLSGRDPQAFERPDELDFERGNVRHLGFGVGPHRCLGMHLARRIIKIALEEWCARIPHFSLAPNFLPSYHYTPVRGVDQLKLVITS